jgi:hypothetical protein
MSDAIHQSQEPLLEDAEGADLYSQLRFHQAEENGNYWQRFNMFCTVGKSC